MGRNYGWVFTAYGVAGILGPLLAGVFKDAASMGASPQVWMTPFMIAGVACLIGALIMIFTKEPSRSGPEIVLEKGTRSQHGLMAVKIRRRFRPHRV